MNAILVGVKIKNDFEFDYSINELENLVKALNIKTITVIKQKLNEPNDKYLLGKGKLEELKNIVLELNPDVVIFDNELTPAQNQNIQDILEVEILDRTALILKIFSMRAKTYESKLQVEIASLRYVRVNLAFNIVAAKALFSSNESFLPPPVIPCFANCNAAASSALVWFIDEAYALTWFFISV